MERKIVQIAFEVEGYVDSADVGCGGGSTRSNLHALCNDGTIWYVDEKEWKRWNLDPIPQDETNQLSE